VRAMLHRSAALSKRAHNRTRSSGANRGPEMGERGAMCGGPPPVLEGAVRDVTMPGKGDWSEGEGKGLVERS